MEKSYEYFQYRKTNAKIQIFFRNMRNQATQKRWRLGKLRESFRVKKKKNHSVGFISLGCPKALVDTEQIANLLVSDYTPSFQEADYCGQHGFIDAAIKESLDSINEAKKKKGYRYWLFRCKKIRMERH